MAYALAKRLMRAVKNAGVNYKEVSGWESRGRATMGSIQSVMCHHTAGPATGNAPSLNVVTNGRAGLSGPLAQFVLGRDGTVFLVGAGRANHAGVVSSSAYQNSHSIGIEAEATGVTSWPDVQIEAYAKLCKALADEFGLPTSRIVGHKEKATPRGRKIDPNFDMGSFRAKVDGATGGVSQNQGGSSGGKSYSAVSYGETLGQYDKGDPVKDWQDFLIDQGHKLADGADGYFGGDTVTATKAFQKAAGLTGKSVDGMAGPDTIAEAVKLGFEWKRKPAKGKPSGKVPGKSYAFPYEQGGYIGPKSGPNRSHSGIGGRKTKGVADSTWNKRFVNQLVARGWNAEKGGTYLTEFGNDGMYGEELAALISAFQKDQGLPVDGLAGASTWDAAFNNPVT